MVGRWSDGWGCTTAGVSAVYSHLCRTHHWLSSHEQIHDCKDSLRTRVAQSKATRLEGLLRLDRARRGQSHQFQESNHGIGADRANGIELKALRQEIPRGLQRRHPRLNRVAHGGHGQIRLGHHFKAGLLERGEAISGGANIRQAIAQFNVFFQTSVLGIVGIVQIRHAPFVTGEYGPRFENIVNLSVAGRAIRSVARRFNSVGSIKQKRGCRGCSDQGRGQFHKIALDTSHLRVRIGCVQFVPALDLVRIECQAGNAALQKGANGASGSANATSHIQNVLGRSKAVLELRGECVFVTTNRSHESFPGKLKGEMKGIAPAPFVKDRGEVIIGVHELLVLFGSGGCVRVAMMQGIVLVNSRIDIVGAGQTAFLLFMAKKCVRWMVFREAEG